MGRITQVLGQDGDDLFTSVESQELGEASLCSSNLIRYRDCRDKALIDPIKKLTYVSSVGIVWVTGAVCVGKTTALSRIKRKHEQVLTLHFDDFRNGVLNSELDTLEVLCNEMNWDKESWPPSSRRALEMFESAFTYAKYQKVLWELIGERFVSLARAACEKNKLTIVAEVPLSAVNDLLSSARVVLGVCLPEAHIKRIRQRLRTYCTASLPRAKVLALQRLFSEVARLHSVKVRREVLMWDLT